MILTKAVRMEGNPFYETTYGNRIMDIWVIPLFKWFLM